MSNGEFCCAIGLCCPPASPTRRTALIHELAIGLPPASANGDPRNVAAHDNATAAAIEHVADWLIAHVDMVPKGTIDLEKVRQVWQAHGHT